MADYYIIIRYIVGYVKITLFQIINLPRANIVAFGVRNNMIFFQNFVSAFEGASQPLNFTDFAQNEQFSQFFGLNLEQVQSTLYYKKWIAMYFRR